jgi:hypothetical protein
MHSDRRPRPGQVARLLLAGIDLVADHTADRHIAMAAF